MYILSTSQHQPKLDCLAIEGRGNPVKSWFAASAEEQVA
jgi:hypothetical protein